MRLCTTGVRFDVFVIAGGALLGTTSPDFVTCGAICKVSEKVFVLDVDDLLLLVTEFFDRLLISRSSTDLEIAGTSTLFS